MDGQKDGRQRGQQTCVRRRNPPSLPLHNQPIHCPPTLLRPRSKRARAPNTRPHRAIEAALPPEVAARVHFFNSFFHKKLAEKDPQAPAGGGAAAAEARGARAHERVKNWTKVCCWCSGVMLMALAKAIRALR